MIKDNFILKPTVCVKGVCFGGGSKGATYFFANPQRYFDDEDFDEFELAVMGLTEERQRYTLVEQD